MDKQEELKKMMDKVNEKSDPEKDLDYYIDKCASRCLSFFLQTGNEEIATAMAVAYTIALVDAGLFENEDGEKFGDAVTERMMVISGLK